VLGAIDLVEKGPVDTFATKSIQTYDEPERREKQREDKLRRACRGGLCILLVLCIYKILSDCNGI
jgi:hypothetical protein